MKLLSLAGSLLGPLLGLALASSIETVSAQGVTAPPLLTPPTIPTEARYVTFDWASQKIVGDQVRPLASPHQEVVDTCFDNSDSPGYIWSLFDYVNDEIVDWGVKSCQQTGVVTEFTFAYLTYAEDLSIGGPGAAMTWTLYQGTNGFGSLGTELARYDLSGLPGSTISGYPTWIPTFVTVDLNGAPLVVPDGNIGWSFMCTDGMSGPLLAYAPQVDLGTRDAVDVYRPGPATNGHFAGTFNWGAGSPFGSFYFELVEADGDIPGWSTLVNGTGVNPMVLSEITPPLLGTNWVTMLDPSAWPTAPSTFIALSSLNLPPVLTSWGEVLIDASAPGLILDIGYALHSVEIPLLPELAGLVLHSQGGVFLGGGSIALTNGIDITLGW
jgi:hypothetical protein